MGIYLLSLLVVAISFLALERHFKCVAAREGIEILIKLLNERSNKNPGGKPTAPRPEQVKK